VGAAPEQVDLALRPPPASQLAIRSYSAFCIRLVPRCRGIRSPPVIVTAGLGTGAWPAVAPGLLPGALAGIRDPQPRGYRCWPARVRAIEAVGAVWGRACPAVCMPVAAWARARRVAVEAEHPGPLVALAAPGRTRRSPRRWQSGGREPGGQDCVGVSHAVGIRSGERREYTRRPASLQGRGDGWDELKPLGGGEPPAVAQCGEELPGRPATHRATGKRCLARTRGGGGRFQVWFLGRFGCSCCTP
jgi:hypothetical protein